MNLQKTNKQTASPLFEKLSLFERFEDGLHFIESKVENSQKPVIVSFINTHGFNLYYANADFKKAILQSDLILRDGTGISILLKALGKNPQKNFCGTDFIPYVLNQNQEKPIALLGTQQPYLGRAATTLTNKGYAIVLSGNGFLSKEDYLLQVAETKPEIIILGMGMPKQEIVAAYLKMHVTYPCLIINGGAIIDYIGKKVSRAPKWMRRAGMEWVYRFILEPKRLFKRYIIGNIVFLNHVLVLKRQ